MKRPDTLANEIEKLLGRASSDALIGASGIDDDPLLTRWVTRIGQEVAVHSDRLDAKPEFVILGSDVANALTLPGSKVLVTRGLLDEVTSDDELAGVLAHEVGHVAKRHAWQQLQNNGLVALLLRFAPPKGSVLRQGLPVLNLLRALAQSRDNEYQADRVGLGFAAAAGYAPSGLLRFIETMASGPMAAWEEYFSTHPAGPKRTTVGRQQPVVRESDVDSRGAVAAGLDARGFAGLAQLARLGRDPLALPALTPASLSARNRQERKDLADTIQRQQTRLLATYKPLVTASTLQQLLLLTAQNQDIRRLILSTHAYLLQFKLQDVYARTLRLLRLAGPTWDALHVGMDPETIECLRGRLEIREALAQIAAVPTPLQRASQASLTVLADLHLGGFYRLNSGAQWTHFAAVEGLIRYAESELARADRAAGLGWRYLAMARVRRYQQQLDQLIPESSLTKRALWSELVERRLGQTVEWSGSAGEASVSAALHVERGDKKPCPLGTSWADWVVQSGGTPENIATVLRLLTLDIQRELAARAYLGWKE
nr:M48 family metalloprotease [Armatimonas sp.]